MSHPNTATPQSVTDVLDWLRRAFRADAIGDLQATYQIALTGEWGGVFWVRVDGGRLSSGEGKTPRPDVVFELDAEDFYGVIAATANPELLYMQDRIRVEGSLSLALKLRVMFLADRAA